MTTTTQITDELTHLTARELWELAEAYFVYDAADATDSGDLARRLGRFHGVVCVEIPPGEPRPLGALALAILQRVGKDLDREKQINQHDAWRLARVWMDAEQIEALIIIGADQLAVSTWKELVDVCRQVPTPSVILIQHQTGRDAAQHELLNGERAFTSVPPATFHDWGARFIAACEHALTPDADAARAEKRRFPAVPGDEIPYFRAACRDALSKPDFRVVDDAYRRSFDSTFRWLQARQDLDEDQAGAFLADQLRWRRDVNEQLTRLRGAQVAFLRHWWLLKVDVEALVAAYRVDMPLDIDDDVYDRLRAYIQPKTSALAAIAITTRLPPGRLAMLNADQVHAGLARRPHHRSRAPEPARRRRRVRARPSARMDARTRPTSTRRPRHAPAVHWHEAAPQRLAAMRDPTRYRASVRSAAAGAAAHRTTRPRPQPHHRPTARRGHPPRARRSLVQDRIQ